MEYTITIRCRNAKELQEVAALLSRKDVFGSAKDMAIDAGVGEKGDKVAYVPNSDRTKRAYDALLKFERVKLSRPAILEQWALTFPDVDLAGELLKCESWAQANSKRRSNQGWAKTLNSWLTKAQDQARAGVAPYYTTSVKVNPAPAVDSAVDEWAKAVG